MKKILSLLAAVLFAGSMMAQANLATFFISSAEINSGKVGTIALGNNAYGSQAVADASTWYTCAKDDYTFKGARVCVATDANGGGIQMQGKASDATKKGFFGNETAFNNIHSLKIVARVVTSNANHPNFHVYTDSLGTTNALTTPNPVTTTEGGFRKYVYTFDYTAADGKFFNIKNDEDGALYIDSIYVTYEAAPALAEWDGTVTMNKANFTSLADLEGLQLTYNGATTLALLDEEESAIYFQNEDGDEIYAIWAPAFGGTYEIAGNVVTLNGWFADIEIGTSPLPTVSGAVYFEDYGSFSVDGDENATFETVEAQFGAAPATTYTVNFTVTGAVAGEAAAQAGYYNEESEGANFVAGANTVPENMIAFVYAQMIEGYTVEVKVNGAAVTLTDGYWEGAITADMTIAVAFSAGSGEVNPWASVYTSNVTFTAGTNSYLTDKINIDGNQYDAFKIGKSSASGSCSVALPAGTTEFHFHAICWSKTADTNLEISGAYSETVVIKAGNISGNSPYTFDLSYADPTKRYYNHIFETALTEAATITFTCDYRAVFFGVNVVTGAATALENVENGKPVKVVENGQVIIIRDGIRYNVAGQIVK